MNVERLVSAINDLSDEQESVDLVVGFINDAISEINTVTSAGFPLLDSTNSNDEPQFPEEWQRLLLIPYGVGRVKQRDSSQFEYTDAYDQFRQALDNFKTYYTVPRQHRKLKPDSVILLPNDAIRTTVWGDTIYKLGMTLGIPWQDLMALNADSLKWDTSNSYESDIYTNPPLPWFGW